MVLGLQIAGVLIIWDGQDNEPQPVGERSCELDSFGSFVHVRQGAACRAIFCWCVNRPPHREATEPESSPGASEQLVPGNEVKPQNMAPLRQETALFATDRETLAPQWRFVGVASAALRQPVFQGGGFQLAAVLEAWRATDDFINPLPGDQQKNVASRSGDLCRTSISVSQIRYLHKLMSRMTLPALKKLNPRNRSQMSKPKPDEPEPNK